MLAGRVRRLTVGRGAPILICLIRARTEDYGNQGRRFPRPGDACAQAQARQGGSVQGNEEAGFLREAQCAPQAQTVRGSATAAQGTTAAAGIRDLISSSK